MPRTGGWSGADKRSFVATQAQGGIMAEPRKGRVTRKANRSESQAGPVAVSAVEPQWTREPRPLLPPLKVGREWDRVRRIAYL